MMLPPYDTQHRQCAVGILALIGAVYSFGLGFHNGNKGKQFFRTAVSPAAIFLPAKTGK